MRFLHCMIRVRDVPSTLRFYELLGLKLVRQKDYPSGQYTLYFLATEPGAPEVELTHNWDDKEYSNGNNFGHLAYEVENIYDVCDRLKTNGVTILRPPRDGKMAFVKDPNGISIELLQKTNALQPQEPWVSMANVGSW
ncbi:lactoylglutathione lyase [Nostoc sp. FACHB-973]|nr:lactoylglutathione lyase [Nostoc sp. FACHB-973]